jgi:hypothetical protein
MSEFECGCFDGSVLLSSKPKLRAWIVNVAHVDSITLFSHQSLDNVLEFVQTHANVLTLAQAPRTL